MKNLKLAIALCASLIAFVCPALAQVGYGKVEQPWYQQGKISAGISVTGSSAATLLPQTGQIAWICNTGSNDAYLAFGSSNAVVATVAGGTWLKASTCGNYDINPFSSLFTYVAAITATSTTTLTVETGIGTGPQQLATSGGGGGGGTVTQGPAGTNAAGWWTRIGDGTNGPAAVTLAGADGVSNTLSGLQTYARTQCYNGTTWDRCTQIGTGTFGTPNTTTVLSVQGGTGMSPFIVVGPTADGTAAATNPVLTAGTVDGTGTGAVAIQKITAGGIASTDLSTVNAVTVLAGTGAVGTGAQRIAVGTDTATVAGSAPGTAGAPNVNVAASGAYFTNVTSSTLTRPADTTAYAANETVCLLKTTTACAPITISIATVNAGKGLINRISLLKSGSSIINASFTIWFFSAAPGVATPTQFDSTSYTGPRAADMPNYIGNAVCVAPVVTSDTTTQVWYDCVLSNPNTGGALDFQALSGATTIDALISVTAAYTPASAETFKVYASGIY